jgi:DNA helicase II / ATP-dependent DNA helicase PcrA
MRVSASSVITCTTSSGNGSRFGSVNVQKDVPSLDVGDKVTHDTYGLGTVIGVEKNDVVKIDFGTNGAKRIALRYTKVTKL